MSDLISRQAAVDVAQKTIENPRVLDRVMLKLYELPSAQPEQKKGKWILDDEYIDCSVCRREKWSRFPYEDLVKRFRFCPNCGAKMEVEHDR